MKNLIIQILSKKHLYLLCSALGLVLVLGFPDEISKQADSEGYILFAEQILDGQLFTSGWASWPTVIRTPGYPLLMAAAQLIFGQNVMAIISLHLALAYISLNLLAFRFATLINPLITVIFGLLSLLLWREYYPQVLTEWSALCFLLVFLSVLPLKDQELTRNRFLLLSFTAACLVLIRPAFLCLIPIVLLIPLFILPKENLRIAFVSILLGLSPLFFWSLFNLYRLDTFNIAAFSGHNLFGTASLIGSAEFDSELEPRMSRFADFVNRNKRPAAGQEEEVLRELPQNYQALSRAHNYNVYQVALNFEKESRMSRQEYDQIMKSYAIKVIFENPRAYIMLFCSGLQIAKRDIWLLLIATFLFIMMVKNGHPFSIVLGVSLFTHLFHLILVSSAQIVIERYYLLTLIPLGLISILSFIAVLAHSEDSEGR